MVCRDRQYLDAPPRGRYVRAAPGSADPAPQLSHRAGSRSRRRTAFTLAETVCSLLLVSGLFVVALDLVSDVTIGRYSTSDRGNGQLLAADLMSEILQQEYEEPDDQPAFGPEGTENVSSRAEYDDVDDYNSWNTTSPAQKDGTPIPGLVGWSRSVVVEWVDPNDLTTTSVTPTDVKRITVTVNHNDVTVAQLVAVKAPELPPPVDAVRVLFPVDDDTTLTEQETARIALMEAWGFTVNLIDTSDNESKYETAAEENDVAYVSEQVSDVDLDTKLRDVTIGVVNEEPELTDEFGTVFYVYANTEDEIYIDDNTHYITSQFDTGLLTICSSIQPMFYMDSGWAPDAQILARRSTIFSDPALAVIETGGTLFDSDTAKGRRVHLPWAAPGFDINALNADGQTVMKRAIEWAANRDSTAVCGDGNCDAGEDVCTCSDDCGAPAASESVGVSCDDGLDNDCDGAADCLDMDCEFEAECLEPIEYCGNSVCDEGEDCHSCSEDCVGWLVGPPAGRFCCGDGISQPAEIPAICDWNP